MKLCAVEGCDRPSRSREYCGPHYKRLLRHGSPLGGAASRDRRSVPERFNDGYAIVESGCWEWLKGLDAHGYGVIRSGGSKVSAHRYSLATFSGLEDVGEVDHKCRNRKCVNPEHLRQVKRHENTQNQATIRQSRSGYRGVAWHEHSKSWHVVVKFLGHQHSGGYFKDVHAAGRAAIELRNSLYTHTDEDRRMTA